VEPVKTKTGMTDLSCSGSGRSMHDSSLSWGAHPQPPRPRDDDGQAAQDAGNGAAFTWEVRLVQEFCDLGSIRDALKQGKFRWEVLLGIRCCQCLPLLECLDGLPDSQPVG